MKALTLFLSMLFSLPFALSAQSAGEMLQRVSAAIDNKQWEQAISLFRQAREYECGKGRDVLLDRGG